ncbi:MAG: hypothetical protein IJ737_07685 [Ruminococcus sp.]|nr:hypothetical protein [Ruminococcus sp.]
MGIGNIMQLGAVVIFGAALVIGNIILSKKAPDPDERSKDRVCAYFSKDISCFLPLVSSF